MPPRPKSSFRVLTTRGDPARTAPRGKLWAVAPLPTADDFDLLLDADSRRVSSVHWTPRAVCHRAAELLALQPGQRVLDVGSGVGKFCVLASLVSAGDFFGVEQRESLVVQARSLACSLGSRAEFLHGDAFDLNWSTFDALYFYNPFDEVRFAASSQIDGSIQTGAAHFDRLVARAKSRLAELAVGTRIVTFHGMGGPMPAGFQLQAEEPIADGSIQLWQRVLIAALPP